jgi:hypothetical protein
MGGRVLKLGGIVLALTCAVSAGAAEPAHATYDPAIDGFAQLQAAGKRAGTAHKRILVVVGGNWCKWCRALDTLLGQDVALKAELAGHYEIVHLNYSKENRNPRAMAALGDPASLGFPSLHVLSPKLEIIKAQSSDVFETEDPAKPGHDPARLLAFLKQWER